MTEVRGDHDRHTVTLTITLSPAEPEPLHLVGREVVVVAVTEGRVTPGRLDPQLLVRRRRWWGRRRGE